MKTRLVNKKTSQQQRPISTSLEPINDLRADKDTSTRRPTKTLANKRIRCPRTSTKQQLNPDDFLDQIYQEYWTL
jgi:hypothetical protein